MNRETEWRDSWPTVLAAFLGVAASAMPSFTLGVMMKPLSDGYGWSRSEITSMITIVTIFMLTLSPLIGGLVDRHGARRIVLVACFVLAFGFASLSLAGPAIWSWYVASAFLGVGMAMAGATVWISAVARRFHQRRAFALSVALSGLGLSLGATPALTTAALGLVGFRHVYFLLAGVAFLCCFPTGLLFFRDAPRAPASRPGAAAGEHCLRFTEAL
ncbi:MAG: MFS transporter [Sphingomonadaceae bacterium]|nr:MFS transporter [Sphingomonadaceae bacterium]